MSFRSMIGATAAAGLFATGLVPVRSLAAQSAVPGDTLVVSLEEARSIAVRANPALLASSWRPAAARGDVRSARTLQFNPELVFESRSPSTGIASRYEAELGLALEVAGQRGLRVGASEAGYQAAAERYHDNGRLILREVEQAYHRLVAAEQREALADQISALNAELETAVSAQRIEGEVSLLEANLAGIEAARARAGLLEARSTRTTSALELGRLLGLGTDTLVVRTVGVGAETSAPPDPAADSVVAAALAARPDLLAAEQDIERSRQEARLAGREAYPNLRIAALATRDDPLVDPLFGVSAGIELPLLNRNQGLTQRRRAEIAEAEQARRATELLVREEVESALRAYESARREVALLEAEMLGPIRQNQELLEIAFREGKIDLATVLLLRNQLLDAELSYWEAWERRAVARTNLAAATGEILEGVDLIEGGER